MSLPPPDNKPNGYTTFDEPVYFFTDNAIIPPAKAKPPAEQSPAPEPPAEQPDQKS